MCKAVSVAAAVVVVVAAVAAELGAVVDAVGAQKERSFCYSCRPEFESNTYKTVSTTQDERLLLHPRRHGNDPD